MPQTELTETQLKRFERFWAVYPLRVSKGDAKRAFGKKNPDDAETDRWIHAIRKQAEYRGFAASKNEFVPEWKHPATWINKECYDDEVPDIVPFKPRQQAQPAYTYRRQEPVSQQEATHVADLLSDLKRSLLK